MIGPLNPQPVDQQLGESLRSSGRIPSHSSPPGKTEASAQSVGMVGTLDPQPVDQQLS
jgi:hypothetical protein